MEIESSYVASSCHCPGGWGLGMMIVAGLCVILAGWLLERMLSAFLDWRGRPKSLKPKKPGKGSKGAWLAVNDWLSRYFWIGLPFLYVVFPYYILHSLYQFTAELVELEYHIGVSSPSVGAFVIIGLGVSLTTIIGYTVVFNNVLRYLWEEGGGE